MKIIGGISEWIRKSVGTEAENRGENDGADSESDAAEESEKEGEESDESDESGSPGNSPVCCSAASNSDLTVLEE